MSTTRNVAVLVGSLRQASINRKLANVLIAMAPASLKLEIVEIGNLPLFNQDWESDPAPAVRAFKERIGAADAVLFVTPRVQPVGSWRIEERHRRRVATLREECLER